MLGEFTSIKPLTRISTDPPRYEAQVNGLAVRVGIAELIKFKRFQKQCYIQIGFKPEMRVRKDAKGRHISPQSTWETEYLAPALAARRETEEAL